MPHTRDEKTLEELQSEAAQASFENPGNSEELTEDGSNSGELNPTEMILSLEAELAEAKAKSAEYYDQLLRLQADFDNYRKRTQKEKTELVKYASEQLVGELLPVLDNFERATSSAQTSDMAAFAQGVEMILRQLQTTLSKVGLKAMESVGQPFDPNLHEAVLRIDSDEHPENTVVEELQKGYFLKEKVLRPSMVKVSK